MLSDWALDREAAEHGWRIVELAGCKKEVYADTIDCLRNIDAAELVEAQGRFKVTTLHSVKVSFD
jgi:Carboxylesterase family